MAYRYFFALLPTDEIRLAIAREANGLSAALGLRGRPIALNRFHITWAFIGSFNEPRGILEGFARAAGNSITCAPFQLIFDRAVSFGRGIQDAPCVFVGNAVPPEMSRVAAQLRGAMEILGQTTEDLYPLRPHITWLYSPDRMKGEIPIKPIIWQADELCFIRTTSGVPNLSVLMRWPLKARSSD